MFNFEFPPLTIDVFAGAGLIFTLRVFGVALSTVRTLVMMRGKKMASVVLGFFEVLVYVIAIGEVVNNLSNVWNILGYCLGFSAGTLVGMWLDDRLAIGFATVRIISPRKGAKIAGAIRRSGYGATVEGGSGRSGRVGIVTVTVRRREVKEVCALADGIDPDAFVTIEEARTVRRGYMHVPHHGP